MQKVSLEFTHKAQKALDEAHLRGNPDALDGLYSPNIVRHTTDRQDMVGIDAVKAHVAGVRRSFSKPRITLDESMISGDTVTWQWIFEGTYAEAHEVRWVFRDTRTEKSQTVGFSMPDGAKATRLHCCSNS